MESERFASYIDPFEIVANNPIVVFVGQGLTVNRVKRRGHQISGSLVKIGNRNVADHSVFAMATIKYGMLSAFCYLGLWCFSTLRAHAEARIAMQSEGLARYPHN